ncbi:MAG: glycosyltransferase family 39 protein [Sedimentisphaerales bacterium]
MTCETNSVVLENTDSPRLRKNSKILLIVILLVAAILRLINLRISPPGLNQDEASNAWSAYCLLETGKDHAGASWPVYYTRGLGGNNTTLYMYMIIPFQAIGGLNIYTTRLPAAFCGIFAVWLIYYVAKKLFNTDTGLAAAALLALNPWHLQLSRWGQESSIAPLLGLVPLAGMLWANLPVGNNKSDSPRPIIAGISGILAGIGCFGYHSVRLFVPIFIFALVIFNLPLWWRTLRTKKGALATALFVLGFTAIFGQLLYLHIFHPEGIGRHAAFQRWVGSAGLIDSLKHFSLRYIQHFGLDFLFIRGDHFIMQGPAIGGEYHWYELPLMIAGAIAVLGKFKSSASLRTVAAYVVLFPTGDSFGWGLWGLHALRSAPGLCALTLLSAVGLIAAVKWFWKQNPNNTKIGIIAFALIAIGLNTRFLYHFFGEFNRRPAVYHLYHTDLTEACDWLKPHFDDFDAVYVTTLGLNMPYVVTAVALNYDPNRWFSEPIEISTATTLGIENASEWDFYTRYGKMHFIYDYTNFSILELQKKFAPGRLLFILRPDEYSVLAKMENIENPTRYVVHRIIGPENSDVLWLCRF